MLEQDDYDLLVSAIFNEAVGEDDITTKQQVAEKKTDNGIAKVVKTRNAPNAQLAMKLLESRIGGPQDWC